MMAKSRFSHLGGALMGHAGRGGHRRLGCQCLLGLAGMPALAHLQKTGLCRCPRGRILQVGLAGLQVDLLPLAS